jgi:Uma2 family endonuclease
MAVLLKPRKFTPEEYLILERGADFKSEYYYGEIYAMAGGSPQHGAIAINLGSEVRASLKGKPCQAFSSDLKVRTRPDGLFAYPDVSVVCGELQFHDAAKDVVTNPTVIFEVLSESTEAYDRGRKFQDYQLIETLTDYVMISQNEPCIEHYVRKPNDKWLLTTTKGLQGQVFIASIECTLLLSEVYDKIDFPLAGEQVSEE